MPSAVQGNGRDQELKVRNWKLRPNLGMLRPQQGVLTHFENGSQHLECKGNPSLNISCFLQKNKRNKKFNRYGGVLHARPNCLKCDVALYDNMTRRCQLNDQLFVVFSC